VHRVGFTVLMSATWFGQYGHQEEAVDKNTTGMSNATGITKLHIYVLQPLYKGWWLLLGVEIHVWHVRYICLESVILFSVARKLSRVCSAAWASQHTDSAVSWLSGVKINGSGDVMERAKFHTSIVSGRPKYRGGRTPCWSHLHTERDSQLAACWGWHELRHGKWRWVVSRQWR
jgi:hypothetical protein